MLKIFCRQNRPYRPSLSHVTGRPSLGGGVYCIVFVDTILLLSVENVRFFQGKILERESHEMKSPSWQRKVLVVNNSEHFVRMDKICI